MLARVSRAMHGRKVDVLVSALAKVCRCNKRSIWNAIRIWPNGLRRLSADLADAGYDWRQTSALFRCFALGSGVLDKTNFRRHRTALCCFRSPVLLGDRQPSREENPISRSGLRSHESCGYTIRITVFRHRRASKGRQHEQEKGRRCSSWLVRIPLTHCPIRRKLFQIWRKCGIIAPFAD